MARDDAERKKKRPAKDFLDWMGLTDTPNWPVARPLGPLLSVILALLFTAALLAAFVTLGSIISGSNAGLGAGALIVAILGAPFLIWNTVIRHRALYFQREGHITDRLAKAVEQLGTEKTVKSGSDGKSEERTEPNIEVRIGGLLSLERIAQDSVIYDKGRDHVRVMEIICAYIRENAPARNAVPFPTDNLSSENLKNWRKKTSPVRQDVMLALNILSRRTNRQCCIEAAHGQEGVTEADWPFESQGNQTLDQWLKAMRLYKGYRLDLSDTCLQRADLRLLNLGGTKLERSYLDMAEMELINLNGAQLSEANLNEALLPAAKLNGVNLHKAELCFAQLSGAHLSGAHLFHSKFMFAQAHNVYLIDAQFNEAQLSGAKLIRARLCGANFSQANLSGAELHESCLAGADLRYCLNLTEEQITACFGDTRTKLPNGYARPDQWQKYLWDGNGVPNEYKIWLMNYVNAAPPPKPSHQSGWD